MEMHDAWFFIGVFVFIFLIWVATGGPLHPISFTGPRLALPGALGGGTYLQLPRSPFGVGNTDTSLPGSSSGGSSSGAGGGTPPPVGGSAFGPVSPYRSIVSLSHYISGADSIDPKNESVQFYVSQNAGLPVDITGWTFTSDATGKTAMIPKGTETPVNGVVNAGQDLVLLPGERATIISGSSPIGTSFRENKCIGYFSSFQKFSPSLPQNCPVPSAEMEKFYGAVYVRDSACVDYVKNLSRCQVVFSPPPGLSGTCQNFMVKYLNYNGCVDAHKNDADFKGDTWRVYLGRTTSMWRSRNEVVRLLDINGKTVDAFSY